MKNIARITVLLFTLQLAGCGVLLHPERQGQTGGKIDPAVAILDGVGLLLYLIPGLVAFAIDFHQGTIYLPNSQSSATNLGAGYKTVKIEGEISKEKIESIIEKELSLRTDLSDPEIQVQSLNEDFGYSRPISLALLSKQNL